jgi:hypothetical protein
MWDKNRLTEPLPGVTDGHRVDDGLTGEVLEWMTWHDFFLGPLDGLEVFQQIVRTI